MGPDVLWVGIDVGRYFHAFCALEAGGQVVWQRKRVMNTTVCIRRALDQLRRFARGRALRFGAEEVTGNGAALLRLLAESQEVVYLTQPLRVHRFHQALGQPHKNDPYDAQVIADFARQNAARLPQVRTNTPAIQALRVLSRRLDTVKGDLRRHVSRLRGTLAEYAPEWLACGLVSDWTTNTALGLLQRYGRISKLRRTPLSRLTKALSGWSRGRWGEAQARVLKQAFCGIIVPEVVEEAYVQVLLSLVAQIRVLLAEKGRLRSLVEVQGQRVPAMRRLLAEPCYGVETAATITSEAGDMGDFTTEPRFAAYCGVTPINRQSGTSQGSSRLARFTNKRLLRAVYQSAVTAVATDPRSRAYYHKKLRGRTDPVDKTRALLALARHRTRDLYHILQEAWT
jgi:transposase